MRINLFFATVFYCALTSASIALAENLVFTIDEVTTEKGVITFKAHDNKEQANEKNDCKKKKYERICVRAEIEAFKWYFGVDSAYEFHKRTFEGTDFETAFQRIVAYSNNMSPDQKLANLLCTRAQDKIRQPLPAKISIKETDFPDKISLRPELLVHMNERLATKTNGKAVFVAVDTNKCTNCANFTKDIPCFAILLLKHNDNSKKDYRVIVTSNKEIPLIFPYTEN